MAEGSGRPSRAHVPMHDLWPTHLGMHIFGAHLQMSDQHCSVKTEIATTGILCVCGGDTMGHMTRGHLECSSTFCEISTNMAVTRLEVRMCLQWVRTYTADVPNYWLIWYIVVHTHTHAPLSTHPHPHRLLYSPVNSDVPVVHHLLVVSL